MDKQADQNKKLDDLRKQVEKMDERFVRYRAQGLALMTTVISLSTGVIYGSKEFPFFSVVLVALLPAILMALWHEYFDYCGKKYEARYHFHMVDGISRQRNADLDEASKRFTTALNEDAPKFTAFYDKADKICECTVKYFTSALISGKTDEIPEATIAGGFPALPELTLNPKSD